MILLVESNEKLANQLFETLSEIDGVSWSKDTRCALIAIHKLVPDIIVLGNCNTYLSSLEFLELLPKVGITIPAIMLSNSEQDFIKAIKFGAKAVISFQELRELNPRIKSLIAERSQNSNKSNFEKSDLNINTKTVIATVGIVLLVAAQVRTISLYLYGGLGLVILATHLEAINFFRELLGKPLLPNPNRIVFNTRTFLLFAGLVGGSYGFLLDHEAILTLSLSVIAATFNLPTSVVDSFVNAKKKKS